MAEAEADAGRDPVRIKIPPPVPGGIEELESLGWFVDNVIMGHARTDRRIEREMAPHLLRDDEMPPDPPPSEAPPPVPDGDEPKRPSPDS